MSNIFTCLSLLALLAALASCTGHIKTDYNFEAKWVVKEKNHSPS